MAEMKNTFQEGAAYELNFWRRFVKSDQFALWLKPEPTPELGPVVTHILSKVEKGSRCLDVGSGVASVLTGFPFNIITLDPLAEMYKTIFDYSAYGITPPLPMPAEDIHFKNSFDVVHMRNALDHTQEPHKVIRNLIEATTCGGLIIIHGFVNEADAENWRGFHQWNIDISEDGAFKINESMVIATNVDMVRADKIKLPNGKQWFIWIAKRY